MAAKEKEQTTATNGTSALSGLFTEKLRPKSFSQMILLPRVREELSKGLVDNVLCCGRPGTGKTTASRILAGMASDALTINASQDRGIDIIRDKIMSFGAANSLFDGEQQLKVVVLEECDNLTNDAWAALRSTIELFSNSVRFVANCNYIERVPDPIQSRFNVIPFEPLNVEEENYLFNEYVNYMKLVLPACKITFDEGVVEQFVKADFPDMRSLVKKCQQFVTRGITHLSIKDLGTTFDCSDLYNLIAQVPDPVNNYKLLVANWQAKADEAILMIGKNFIDYLLVSMPEKTNKIPMIVIAIAEYQAQVPMALDKFVVLLALVYKLQMIMNS